MSEEQGPAPSAPPQPPSPTVSAIGTSCAVMSAGALLYAADYIFLRLPRLTGIFHVMKANVEWPLEAVFNYGWVFWIAAGVCVALSLVLAIRNPGQPRTIKVNVAVLAAALILAFVARQAAWHPFLGLFQAVPN